MTIKFGVGLPTIAWPNFTFKQGLSLRHYAQRIEAMGYDGIWVADHLLSNPPHQQVSWLSSLLSLSHAAAVTDKVDLGTGVLVVALRHPVTLAKELSTLNFLSGGRLILGFGLGWVQKDLEVVGVPIRERGRITDESIQIIRQLFAEPTVNHSGAFWQFKNVSLEPRGPLPRMWSAGGPQPGKLLSERVLKRIALSDGWFPTSRWTAGEIGNQWFQVKDYLKTYGRSTNEFPVAIMLFFHMAGTSDSEKAETIQRKVFQRFMPQRTWLDLKNHYPMGSGKDMTNQIRSLVEAGVNYFILHPLTDDPEQLELLKDEVVDNFTRERH